ncbi:hypothetical protein SSX86_001345 [Deinandra increscens subsp. villosa]|uniref:Uncharacterized protein n=1 Tax=Deinandra increscens subsp. villosa TaxID=3103831 RepID=A0AAP0DV56_9ASTR
MESVSVVLGYVALATAMDDFHNLSVQGLISGFNRFKGFDIVFTDPFSPYTGVSNVPRCDDVAFFGHGFLFVCLGIKIHDTTVPCSVDFICFVLPVLFFDKFIHTRGLAQTNQNLEFSSDANNKELVYGVISTQDGMNSVGDESDINVVTTKNESIIQGGQREKSWLNGLPFDHFQPVQGGVAFLVNGVTLLVSQMWYWVEQKQNSSMVLVRLMCGICWVYGSMIGNTQCIVGRKVISKD